MPARKHTCGGASMAGAIMRRDTLSPRHTTRWDELPIAKA